MFFQKGCIKKICSFYAGECHLATMMLPYLAKQVETEVEIYTILDKDMKIYIDKLLEKVNIQEKVKQKIQMINWNNNPMTEKCMENFIKERLGNNKELTLIIKVGDTRVNIKLDKIIKDNIKFIRENNINLNLIYCYEVSEIKDTNKIMDEYDYILNTSGIHEIKDVFGCTIEKEEKIIENKFVG